MVGGNIVNLKSMNQRLENKGYPKLPENLISLGGGGHGIIGRVIIGGEGHGFIGKKTTGEKYNTSIGIGYGLFDIGYIAYSTRGLNIYPLLGLGGGGINIRIVERKETLSFDDVLDNPKGIANLSQQVVSY